MNGCVCARAGMQNICIHRTSYEISEQTISMVFGEFPVI